MVPSYCSNKMISSLTKKKILQRIEYKVCNEIGGIREFVAFLKMKHISG